MPFLPLFTGIRHLAHVLSVPPTKSGLLCATPIGVDLYIQAMPVGTYRVQSPGFLKIVYCQCIHFCKLYCFTSVNLLLFLMREEISLCCNVAWMYVCLFLVSSVRLQSCQLTRRRFCLLMIMWLLPSLVSLLMPGYYGNFGTGKDMRAHSFVCLQTHTRTHACTDIHTHTHTYKHTVQAQHSQTCNQHIHTHTQHSSASRFVK